MSSGKRDDDELPPPLIKRRRHISPIWAIPIVAFIVAGWLVYETNSDTGQTIRVTFLTGEGLEAGKTRIKHNSVDVGLVDKVELSPDLKTVIVTATMKKMADPFLNAATQFWVVRPRISLSSLSGLETLLSDKYIEMDPVNSGPNAKALGEPSLWCRYTGLCAAVTEFTGLEEPPPVRAGVPGKELVLEADRLGSITPGAPIYYNGETVGEVLSTSFNADSGKGTIKVQVNDPYTKLVHVGSRFYNASGITVTAGLSGVTIEMESIPALLSGGIAFMGQSEAGPGVDAAAPSGARFPLYANRSTAHEASYVQRVPFLVEFDGSVHGLEVGAPVEFRGIKVGNVTAIHVQYDPRDKNPVRIPVTVAFEPQRVLRAGLSLGQQSDPENVLRAMKELIDNGMRAQLRSQSLLSGALYVAFDIFPDAKSGEIRLVDNPDGTGKLYELPTVTSEMANLETTANGLVERVARLIDRMNDMPLEAVLQDTREMLVSIKALAQMPQIKEVLGSLGKTLDSADGSLHRLDTLLASADSSYGNGSDVRRNLNDLLRQLQQTAKGIQVLADSLERHPESFIRGKGMIP